MRDLDSLVVKMQLTETVTIINKSGKIIGNVSLAPVHCCCLLFAVRLASLRVEIEGAGAGASQTDGALPRCCSTPPSNPHTIQFQTTDPPLLLVVWHGTPTPALRSTTDSRVCPHKTGKAHCQHLQGGKGSLSGQEGLHQGRTRRCRRAAARSQEGPDLCRSCPVPVQLRPGPGLRCAGPQALPLLRGGELLHPRA